MRRKHRIVAMLAIILALCAVIAGLSLHRKGKGTEPGGGIPGTETELPAEGGPKKLVMALDDPLDSACGRLALAFKKEVESISGGALTIDIYENGLLGQSTDLLSTIGDDTNAADIMLVSADILAKAGCQNTAKLLESYRFNSHGAFMKWAVSNETAALLEEPQKSGLGVTGLFFAEDGFRYLFLRENSRDAKGKKIAAEAGDQGEAYVSQIGGEYAYMPSIDIKAAILDGSLDGAEQGLQFYKNNALWEAAPYIVADYHSPSIYGAIITLEAAGELSGEEREILKVAGGKAAKESMEAVMLEEESMLEELAGYGAKQIKLKK